MNVRRLDHLNLLASGVAAFRDFQLIHLGGRLTETIIFDEHVKGACRCRRIYRWKRRTIEIVERSVQSIFYKWKFFKHDSCH